MIRTGLVAHDARALAELAQQQKDNQVYPD